MENKSLKKAHIRVKKINRTCYIYPNAIYQKLLSSLKEMFKDIPYIIPSNSSVYFKIREIRNILNLVSIQTVRQSPLRDKRNCQLFLRRFWEGEIHGEHHT
ncbi:hypothetical protein HZS_324, partial [Henneguya salminicola]